MDRRLFEFMCLQLREPPEICDYLLVPGVEGNWLVIYPADMASVVEQVCLPVLGTLVTQAKAQEPVRVIVQAVGKH